MRAVGVFGVSCRSHVDSCRSHVDSCKTHGDGCSSHFVIVEGAIMTAEGINGESGGQVLGV